MKNLFALVSVASSCLLFSQIGINTEMPNATLDIVAFPDKPSYIDGFIAPRLEGSELQGKNSLYTSNQTGTLVYIKSASPGAGTVGDKTMNVDAPGYYYFDGNVWVKSGSSSAIEPWNVQNTSNKSQNNTDNIYQKGKVAVGFAQSDAVSEKQFEVKGDIKTQYTNTADGYIYGFQTNMTNNGQKENLMYVSDNENFSAANHYSFLGQNKNTVAFMNLDKTDASNLKFNMINASAVGQGGLVALASETSTGKYASIGGITWTDDVEGSIQTRQIVGTDNLNINLNVRPKTGITFQHTGTMNTGAYTFPKNSPTNGQVLIGSAITGGSSVGRQLEWKKISEIPLEGITLKSSGGNCFNITVNDSGVLSTVAAACP